MARLLDESCFGVGILVSNRKTRLYSKRASQARPRLAVSFLTNSYSNTQRPLVVECFYLLVSKRSARHRQNLGFVIFKRQVDLPDTFSPRYGKHPLAQQPCR